MSIFNQNNRLFPWVAGGLSFLIFLVTSVTILEVVQDNSFTTPIKKNLKRQLTKLEIFLPQVIFDGKVTIPKTNVIVSYPTVGINKSGIWFVPYQNSDGIYMANDKIEVASSTRENGQKSVEITIDVRDAKNQGGLGSLIKELNNKSSVEYAPNGSVLSFGSNIFYIAKIVRAKRVFLEAYTRVNDKYVHVEFVYSTEAQNDKALASANEEIFYEYLKKLEIKES